MLSQLQNLRAFVGNHLADVIDWNRHVQPDPARKTNAEVAGIIITTPFNRYLMELGTSYSEPPPAASFACKSLGWVAFHDDAANKHFLGPKADLLFADIAKHVAVRELTDALSAARREVAEASPEMAGAARVKFTEIAERAKKRGIDVNVPEGPAVVAQPSQ
jgi:hypothetical protein